MPLRERESRRRHRSSGAPSIAPRADRWMISYADVVTLLLPVFVVVFMTGRSEEPARAEPVPVAVVDVVEAPPEPPPVLAPPVQLPATAIASTETLDPEAPETPPSPEEPTVAVEKEIEALVAASGLSRQVQTRRERRGLVVSLIEAGFFETGSATPRRDALPVIDALARILAARSLHLRVEGHTDNTPIRTTQFPSNWELSTARATWLVAYFANTLGLAPERLSAAGYGEFRPVANNETPEGRAKNRRIDIVVLEAPGLAEEPPSPVAPPAPAP